MRQRPPPPPLPTSRLEPRGQDQLSTTSHDEPSGGMERCGIRLAKVSREEEVQEYTIVREVAWKSFTWTLPVITPGSISSVSAARS